MHNKQQAIQEWNLNFLEEHLERISHQNKYKEIDPINIVEDIHLAVSSKNEPGSIPHTHLTSRPLYVLDIYNNEPNVK